jgi:oligopeptide/dipeptide ABC transporter ATP-binding protein
MPAGCRFNTRCSFAEARCFVEDPQLEEASPGHHVACHVLPTLNVA